MCSTMTIPITRRTTSTALGELVAPVPRGRPSPFSQLTVSARNPPLPTGAFLAMLTMIRLDAKQARDLVSVLQEAKQQIAPRLAEMARYGGGGGGGRYGGYRGRGGGGGGYRGVSRRIGLEA